ncbi:hypothetical protein M378DRAFT_155943 [Amanita muscaria Koide BX008]|uniref:Uncharacterized protein n=1 Tax=Amanita muscaria (strain Koide BX008) TaxID=946122 RepID=A0A0C2XN40_AMAMK|nr:hypothetical protein M378DRAFT_155943 [Amanita muscaria Koide BX008]
MQKTGSNLEAFYGIINSSPQATILQSGPRTKGGSDIDVAGFQNSRPRHKNIAMHAKQKAGDRG